VKQESIYALSLDAKMTQAIHVKKDIILQRVPVGRGVGGQRLLARIPIDILRLIQLKSFLIGSFSIKINCLILICSIFELDYKTMKTIYL